ncbi:hypothetical protein F0L68_27210 [Solihabitans fulvus]|uniref:Transcriptional regulator n=1 Tax=Solihabitans fulvus TaxID=1892852 RepID=A0A5B2WVY8_9PSEU|nr:hypothetical protein [Solihabitans fulvus]KAA2256133.1 hypothetical protein F0L68_27210 [Solihabitans fulvus]
MAELSGRDLNRRNFLLGSTFTAAAYSAPVLLAITVPTPAIAARASTQRISRADVEVIRSTVRHFERLGRKYGGGRTREQVVQFLNTQAKVALDGQYTEQVGRELFAGVAQATWLAALTSADAGRHALAQRYYTQALNLSLHAGDRPYAANVLADMSREAIDLANGTDNDTDRVRTAQHAAALGRAAVQVADQRATPVVTSYLHSIEARGFALLGDATATNRAVADAQRAFERAGGAEPDWLGHYGEPDLLADVGQCLRDTGRPQQGVALLEQAYRALPSDRVTARAKTQVHLAAGYLALRDFEQAEAVTGQALTAIAGLASTRTVERVRALQHRARRSGRDRRLAAIDERIGVFLRELA